MIYGEKDYDAANALLATMRKAAGGFGIRVDEPQYVEVKTTKAADVINGIMQDINAKTCKIIVVLLFDPNDKK